MCADGAGVEDARASNTPSPDDLVSVLARTRDALQAARNERDDKVRLIRNLELHELELAAQNNNLREAQAALEEARVRYADLFEFVPVASLSLDRRGCIHEANGAARALLGDRGRSPIGKPFATLAKLDEPQRFWAHLERCFEELGPVRTELGMRDARGRSRVLGITSALRVAPLQVEPTCSMALTEITERLEILDRYRIFADAVSEYALIMLDAAGRIITWNKGAERLYGYASAAIEGRGVFTFHTGGDLGPEHYAATLARAATKGRVSLESWCTRADGSRFFGQIVLSPIQDGNAAGIRGFAQVTRDLSDRTDAETVLRRALSGVAGSRITPRRLRSANWVAERMSRWGTSRGFTGAEMQTAQLAVFGLSNKEIARERRVSMPTVRTQLSACFRKADATSRGEFTFKFFASVPQESRASEDQ